MSSSYHSSSSSHRWNDYGSKQKKCGASININHKLAQLYLSDDDDDDNDEIVAIKKSIEVGNDGKIKNEEISAAVVKFDEYGNPIKSDIYMSNPDKHLKHQGHITLGGKPKMDILQLKNLNHVDFGKVDICEHEKNIKSAIKTYFDKHHFSNPDSAKFATKIVEFCKEHLQNDKQFIKQAYKKLKRRHREISANTIISVDLNKFVHYILFSLERIINEFEVVYDILKFTDELIKGEIRTRRNEYNVHHKHTIKGKVLKHIRVGFGILFYSLLSKVSYLLSRIKEMMEKNPEFLNWFKKKHDIDLFILDSKREKSRNVKLIKASENEYHNDLIYVAFILKTVLYNFSEQWNDMAFLINGKKKST